jgi:non-heme chloroperoxidase
MLRLVYYWLLRLHPAHFRKRFAEEMLSIFDEADDRFAASKLAADGFVSLLRQWTLRSEYREEKRPELVHSSAGGVPVFHTFDSFTPRTSALIDGAVLTLVVFCAVSLVVRYSWTHPVLIPFNGMPFASSSDDKPSASPGVLPTEETELEHAEGRATPPSSGAKAPERVSSAVQRPAFSRPEIPAPLSKSNSDGRFDTTGATLLPNKPTRSPVATSSQVSSRIGADSSPHVIRLIPVASDVKLEVLDWGGSGRPVVLLAGLGNTAHVFDDFAPKLATTFHVYGVTRRGFGTSDVPPDANGNYSADRLGDDVLAVVDSLGLNRPVLVGHSIAGEELSSIGVRHPEKVSGLVYLDAGYSYAFYDRSRGDLILDSLELRRQLEQLIPGKELQERKQVVRGLLITLPRFQNELRAYQKDMQFLPRSKQAAGRVPLAVQAIVAGEQKYTDIRCPILAIFAVPHNLGAAFRGDPAARAAAEATDTARTGAEVRAFAVGLPSARVVRLRNASHFVFQSNEADVLREISAFVGGLP